MSAAEEPSRPGQPGGSWVASPGVALTKAWTRRASCRSCT